MTNLNETIEEQTELEQTTIGRRALLKALAATGGAVAAVTLLPTEWTNPVIETGVLPVHAQTSPTAVPTAAPTNTPGPIAIITSCTALNANGNITIGPADTIAMSTSILPTISGIGLTRTITLNEAGHGSNGVIDVQTGATDASGAFTGPDFDLSTISPSISTGVDRITILWEFTNSSEGTGTCNRGIEII